MTLQPHSLSSDSGTKSRFVVLGTQRTGTTLIRTCLNSHPAIRCCGEVFNLSKKPYAQPEGYWAYRRHSWGHRIRSIIAPTRSAQDYLLDLYDKSDVDVVGFKLMYSHLHARPFIWQLLTTLNAKAVLVYRKNVLKTLVSRRTAAASGVYHVSKSLATPTAVEKWKANAVHLNIDTLLSDLTRIQNERTDWLHTIGEYPDLLQVCYEDFVADRDNVGNRMLDFLGAQIQGLATDLKKVNPDTLSSVIGNYDEVAVTLRGTSFEGFLDA